MSPGGNQLQQRVRALLDEGLDYRTIADRLRMPPGRVYLIATQVGADHGQGSLRVERPGMLGGSGQQLVNFHQVNPASHPAVAPFLRGRVMSDAPMRLAARLASSGSRGGGSWD